MPSTDQSPQPRVGRAKTLAILGGVVVIGATVFAAILAVGSHLPVPAGAATVSTGADLNAGALFHVLLALSLIILSAQTVGLVFGLIGQPPVIGEMFAGIMLGPSLLGAIAPELSSYLLPADVTSFLGVYAQLGVILYLFLIGLELDLSVVKRSARAVLMISQAGMILPFLLGSGLALILYPVLAPPGVTFAAFGLFVGVSLSVTAFPVLARILTDRKISKSEMGTIALTCAAITDATAWCVLALVASVARSHPSGAVRTVALTVVFLGIFLGVVAPLVRWFVRRCDRADALTVAPLSVLFMALLLTAMSTELIGLHGFLGAFLLGAVIPHDSRVATRLSGRLDHLVAVLFLPVFFASTGLRTHVGLVSSLGDWLWCGGIIAVACVGKFGGTLIGSRVSGFGWRDSAALGVLMNTRGLVELIVLNVGLDLGVISPKLFTMLVLMALVTTFLTSPLLGLLLRSHPWIERAPALDAPHRATGLGAISASPD